MNPSVRTAMLALVAVAMTVTSSSAIPLPVPIQVHLEADVPPPDVGELKDYLCGDFAGADVQAGSGDPASVNFDLSGEDKYLVNTFFLAGYDQGSQQVGTGYWTLGFDDDGGC